MKPARLHAPVGIENVVETECLEGGGQFASDDAAGFHAELFTEGHTHSGSHLDDGLLGRVGDSADDLGSVIHFRKSAHGANGYTLTAEGAG